MQMDTRAVFAWAQNAGNLAQMAETMSSIVACPGTQTMLVLVDVSWREIQFAAARKIWKHHVSTVPIVLACE